MGAAINILDIIETEGLQIKKVGTEYQGPCPFCKDGIDRFHVHPDKGEYGTFWCRVCGRKGDAIQFLRDYKDMGYRAACEYLGKAPKEMERESKGPRTPTATAETKAVPDYEPRVCKAPEEIWSERAEALVEWAYGNLNAPQPPLNLRGGAEGGGVTPLQWLATRGITLESVQRFRLGWTPGENGKDIYRSRESWGLPKELKENGQAKKIWVPIGLTIPMIQDGKVVRVRIRREVSAEAENRYIPVPGGSSAPLVIPAVGAVPVCPPDLGQPHRVAPTKAWVIVESELDAILIAQEVGDVVGVIALGNDCARLDAETYNSVKGSLCILNALDYDKAGSSHTRQWAENFQQAERWPVPKGKDPGDYYKHHGGNIREWIMAGLPPIFKIQPHPHLNPPLEREERKTSPRPQGEGQGEGGVKYHVIEAADGRRVYITDDISEYKRLQREEKIVFNSEELALVTPEAAEKVMDAKEIWKRAEVVEPMDTPDVGAAPVCPPDSRQSQTGQPHRVAPTDPEMTQGGLF